MWCTVRGAKVECESMDTAHPHRRRLGYIVEYDMWINIPLGQCCTADATRIEQAAHTSKSKKKKIQVQVRHYKVDVLMDHSSSPKKKEDVCNHCNFRDNAPSTQCTIWQCTHGRIQTETQLQSYYKYNHLWIWAAPGSDLAVNKNRPRGQMEGTRLRDRLERILLRLQRSFLIFIFSLRSKIKQGAGEDRETRFISNPSKPLSN